MARVKKNAQVSILLPRKRAKILTRTNIVLYLMFLPAAAIFLLFCYLPMGGLAIAFTEYKVIGGIQQWVGFENFRYLMSLPNFWNAFKNTWIFVGVNYLFSIPVPVILAILLNELRWKRYKKTVQTITILPYFVSWVVVAGIFNMMLSPTNGYLNEAIKFFGGDPVYFLGNENWIVGIVTFARIWKGAGYSMIIYLATISGIDQEMYEAAIIDGANKFQQIMRITVPSLMPTVLVVFVLSFSGVMNLFEPVYVFQNAYNLSSSQVLDTYIYEVGIANSRYAIGMTASLFKSGIGFVFVMLANQLSKLVSEDKKGIL